MATPPNLVGRIINLGIDGWIIQDGNYLDMKVGESLSCAIEYYCVAELVPVHGGECSAIHVQKDDYKVLAQVAYRHDECVVLDIGFLVYSQGRPDERFQVGNWFAGELSIGVDPFFWSEDLSKLPRVPHIEYAFRIRRIQLDTTPRVLERVGVLQSEQWTRDLTRESWIDVDETDAWNHNGGDSSYILTVQFV